MKLLILKASGLVLRANTFGQLEQMRAHFDPVWSSFFQ